MIDPSQIQPPDDSGSTTFDRFCYQAQIAFPYCLMCALGGDVVSVVPEHIEDVAIQFDSGWRFLQIKTRDPESGPWKLADITKKKGGGLRSLVRAYKTLGEVPATFELHVEGALARKDPIESLASDRGAAQSEVVSNLQKYLKLDAPTCEGFVRRLRLVPQIATRETIRAHNVLLLGSQASHLDHATICAIYDQMVGLIYTAMQARLLPSGWKAAFLKKGCLAGKSQELFDKKRLTRDHFRSSVAQVSKPAQPLLRRVVDSSVLSATLLEKKLLIGGASQQLIQHAKSLRAQASQLEYEQKTSAIYDDRTLDDVRERLLLRTAGLVNEYGKGPTPAAAIWNRLVETLGDQRSTIDSRGIFHQDPDLLLGEVCQLSDFCKTSWGNADA